MPGTRIGATMQYPTKRPDQMFAFLTVVVFFLAATRATADVNPQVVVLNEGYDKEIDGELFVESTITLVRSGDAVIICDPGMISHQAKLLDALQKQDLQPSDVTHVFVTHIHPDHTANVGLFSEAVLVDAYSIYDKNRWIDHDDNFEITPGVSILRTPGHSTWEVSLIVVGTAEGTYAISHTWWHDDMTPVEDPFAEDQAALEVSREKLLEIADWIIPGHGGPFRNPRKGGRSTN